MATLFYNTFVSNATGETIYPDKKHQLQKKKLEKNIISCLTSTGLEINMHNSYNVFSLYNSF